MVVVWRKRLWRCLEQLCPTGSWTEQRDAIACPRLTCRCLPDPVLAAEVASFAAADLRLRHALAMGREPTPEEVSFRHDPEVLLSRLARGNPPGTVTERRCRFRSTHDGRAVRWQLVG